MGAGCYYRAATLVLPMHSSQKVAVITGAAQGIGRRTAELFAQQGYSLALVDLKPMAATAQEL